MRKNALTRLIEKYLGPKVETDANTIRDLFNLIDGNHRTNRFMFESEWKVIKKAYKSHVNSHSQGISIEQ